MSFTSTRDYAKELDQQDSLKEYRSLFHIPPFKESECIYFCGNSLGLQPKTVQNAIEQELNDWRKLGVHGHLHAKNPWAFYHKNTKQTLAQLVGARPDEVVAMNNLTSNLHLMMVSFYQPTSKKYKILMEERSFSSDQYAVESQVKFHGYNPDDAIIEVKPRKNEYTLRTEDIIKTILEHKDELSLILFGGVNYYTGQVFDMKKITEVAHQATINVGFDLAHAIGNIPLSLHDWGVDFAVWCSYKYLNSGPGGIGGAFIHENHFKNTTQPRFAGWWGYEEKERFTMLKGFKPMYGIDGWQLSNVSVLSMATHQAALQIFEKANINALHAKSKNLTAYLELLLRQLPEQENKFTILTPPYPERGCQLSLLIHHNGKELFTYLENQGIIIDWREPGVIRIAPVPLYNMFEEIFIFYNTLKEFYKR